MCFPVKNFQLTDSESCGAKVVPKNFRGAGDRSKIRACYNQQPMNSKMLEITADVVVDAKGLRCPEPLMVVRNKLMDMASGEVIEVHATDPSTSWDFPKFCKFLGHKLLDSDQKGTEEAPEYFYWIQKK